MRDCMQITQVAKTQSLDTTATPDPASNRGPQEGRQWVSDKHERISVGRELGLTLDVVLDPISGSVLLGQRGAVQLCYLRSRRGPPPAPPG